MDILALQHPRHRTLPLQHPRPQRHPRRLHRTGDARAAPGLGRHDRPGLPAHTNPGRLANAMASRAWHCYADTPACVPASRAARTRRAPEALRPRRATTDNQRQPNSRPGIANPRPRDTAAPDSRPRTANGQRANCSLGHADPARYIAPGDSRRGVAILGAAGLSHGLAKERQFAVSFATGRIQVSRQIPGRHADRPRPPGASITEPEIAARSLLKKVSSRALCGCRVPASVPVASPFVLRSSPSR